MLTIGIIVEGPSDAVAFPELIRKCIGDDIEVIARPCNSKSQLISKFLGILEEFRRVKQGMPVDIALIIRDADNKEPHALVTAMREKYINRTYPFSATPVIIVQELEAWLLADNQALSHVVGRSVPDLTEPLERIAKPKERLQKILSDAKVPLYMSEVARKIAAATRLERLEYRCPSFQAFRQALGAC
jgi:hypothetical protein